MTRQEMWDQFSFEEQDQIAVSLYNNPTMFRSVALALYGVIGINTTTWPIMIQDMYDNSIFSGSPDPEARRDNLLAVDAGASNESFVTEI